jgi:hypothetical protein
MRMTRSLGLVSLGSLLLALAACTNQTPPTTTPPTQQPTIGSPAPAMSVSPAPSTEPLSGTQFRDDFDGASVDEAKWKLFQRSGLSFVKEGRLELLAAGSQPNYPYLLTRENIIPEAGPFYFEFAYEFLAFGRAGVVFALDYLPAESPGEEALTTPFMLSTGFYSNIRNTFKLESGSKSLEGKNGWTPKQRHVLRLEGNDAGQYRLIHDGFEVGTFESKRRPMRFWLGASNFKDVAATSWPHLAIDHVAAGTLSTPMPASPYPTPVASESPSPTP